MVRRLSVVDDWHVAPMVWRVDPRLVDPAGTAGETGDVVNARLER